MSATLDAALKKGARGLGLDLSEAQIRQLLDYLALIQKWTKVYNLTAVRDPAEMLTHHLLDSLAVIAPLRQQLTSVRPDLVEGRGGEAGLRPFDRLSADPARPEHIKLLDVGSGAGLPGIVIAICCPDIAVTCVDTVAKKAAFIQQVAVALRLPNLRGLHARVESLTGADFDIVSSRAFASLVDFTVWSRAALAPTGVWLAMKGKPSAEELAQLPPDVAVFHVEQLTVPGLGAERCIVWLRKIPD